MDTEPHLQSSIRLTLFGRFQATRNGQQIVGLHKRKGERVLAYLALRANTFVDTKKMASDLWKDSPTEDAPAILRHSIAYVRQLLQEDAWLLQSRIGGLCLNLDEANADTLQFDAACARGDAESLAFAQHMAEEQLLADWEDEWIAFFRTRYEQKLALKLKRLGIVGNAGATHSTAYQTWAQQPQATGSAGGALPLPSPMYIKRDADQKLHTAVSHGESIVVVKGARQTGKSSLLARGLQQARDTGRTGYFTDFEQFTHQDLASRETLYMRIIALLADQSYQEFDPSTEWKDHLGPGGNLERFIRRRVLDKENKPVVWALDGVDRLFETDYFGEFFAVLRGMHTKRATEPTVGWHQLTILIAIATEAHLYIKDLNRSPFNVGTRIGVTDFSPEQQKDMCLRFGLTELSDTELAQLQVLFGGHPYLLARALQEIRDGTSSVGYLVKSAANADGLYHDHLAAILRHLSRDTELREEMRSVLARNVCSEEGFYRLRTAGLLSGTVPEDAALRCDLYERYLKRHLL